MKRSEFTDAQIAIVLKQAEDGTSFAEVCRKAGIAEATSKKPEAQAHEQRHAVVH